MSEYLSDKLRILSFVLIIFVVFLHSYNITKSIALIPNLTCYLETFISNGLTRIAVPLFYIVSGYLFFVKKPIIFSDYIVKWKKRLFTLIVPYVFWTIWGLILYSTLQTIPLLKTFFTKELIVDFRFSDYLNSIFIEPIPYQFWFIRDLIILIFISPIINLGLKYLNFFYLIALFLIWIYFPTIGVVTSESLLFFSVGSVFALKFNNLLNIKTSNTNSIILLILYLLLLNLNTVFIINYSYNFWTILLHKLNLLLGILTLWFIYDYLYNKNINSTNRNISYSNYTFFIFASHEPILTMNKKALFYVLRDLPQISIITYLLAPIITIFFCIFIGKTLKKTTPFVYNLITGNR